MSISKRLSRSQQDALIDHVDGPQPIRVRFPVHRRLTEMGLLRYCYADGSLSISKTFIAYGPTKRPTHTKLTDAGRGALAQTLASFADALSRAGAELQVEAMISEALRRAELTNAAPPQASSPGAGALAIVS